MTTSSASERFWWRARRARRSTASASNSDRRWPLDSMALQQSAADVRIDGLGLDAKPPGDLGGCEEPIHIDTINVDRSPASASRIRQPCKLITTIDPHQEGLEGVVAFATEIAEPDRDGGSLRYRGVDVEELVGAVPFERVWGLLVDDRPELSAGARRAGATTAADARPARRPAGGDREPGAALGSGAAGRPDDRRCARAARAGRARR